jgi:hypothetical protein
VTPAVATVEWQTTSAPQGNATALVLTASSCSDAAFEVVTEQQPVFTVDSNGGVNNAFVSGPAAQSDEVGFTIVIP